MSVLVVGAGPTGLALAIWLKTLKQTLDVRIVDKASGPGTTSRAIIIHARTLEYYRQLGVVEEIIAHGKVVEGISLLADGEVRGTLKFGNVGGDTTKYPFVTSLPQDEHEKILIRHLHGLGVEVEWNTAVTTFSQTDDKVSVSIGESEKLEVDFLAGCDGSHSAVRKHLDVAMQGDKYPSRFYVADVAVSSANFITRLRFCLGSTLFGVCLPLGPNEDSFQVVRVLGVVPKDCDEHAQFEDFSGSVAEVMGFTIKSIKWSSLYNVYHRVASHFRVDRVFLVGDAAHIHSPVGGQGMNTGLGDAANLAWKLTDSLDKRQLDNELLDSYESERRAFAQILVNTTDRILHALLNQGWLGFVVRRIFFARILPWLWKLPFVPGSAFRMVSQLAVSYRQSHGNDIPAKGGLRAGDRLPWTGGAGVDNHAALKELRTQVHRYSRDQNANFERDEDSKSSVHSFTLENPERFDLYPDFDYHIRPDGYIGAIKPRSS